MSSIPRQLATFVAVLAVLYTGGFIAGQFIDTSHDDGMADMTASHDGGHPEGAKPVDMVRGLAVAQHGLRLALDTPELARGRARQLRFRILGGDGQPVCDFEVEHEKRMHLILVRRDLSGFQHLHPEMREDGTWTVPVRVDTAGSYRVFADFVHDGTPRTLAADLRVDGDADLEALPAPRATAPSADGAYEVALDAGAARAGREGELSFTVTRGGERVHTERYLGAGGHLVALREGDLAFLHVHPTSAGHGEDADRVAFAATFPTEGRYRLFLQFKHRGKVRTAVFTHAVGR